MMPEERRSVCMCTKTMLVMAHCRHSFIEPRPKIQELQIGADQSSRKEERNMCEELTQGQY